MAQMVTRIDDDRLAKVDALVAEGLAASRSDAVRTALDAWIDMHRRRREGQQIVEGYLRMPQTDDEVGWSDDQTLAMIAEEPW